MNEEWEGLAVIVKGFLVAFGVIFGIALGVLALAWLGDVLLQRLQAQGSQGKEEAGNPHQILIISIEFGNTPITLRGMKLQYNKLAVHHRLPL